jgi:hypothetical protein
LIILEWLSTINLSINLLFNIEIPNLVINSKIESVFPEGEVPYTPNDAPAGTEHTRLIHEWRKFNHFVKGVSDISQIKREVMYIQMLESLHHSEAEILCLVKDKQLHKRFKLTKVVVQEAFPNIVWD